MHTIFLTLLASDQVRMRGSSSNILPLISLATPTPLRGPLTNSQPRDIMWGATELRLQHLEEPAGDLTPKGAPSFIACLASQRIIYIGNSEMFPLQMPSKILRPTNVR